MCLVARYLEANGLPTLCLGSARDILASGRPPRAVFVDYPLGHSAGKPFDRADQLDVLRGALRGFETIGSAGEILQLPNRWSATDDWKAQAASPAAGDVRQTREATPQFQHPDDLAAACATGALQR